MKHLLLPLATALLWAVWAQQPVEAAGTFKFLSLGDWGLDTSMIGLGIAKYFAEEGEGAPLALLLGDNFYEYGVKSVDDPQWKSKYLDVFSAKSLEKIRFMVASGNHDYYGNVTAQIEYTKKDPTKRWMFPAYYHARFFEHKGVKIFVAVVDTWRLNGGDAIFGHDPTTGGIWLRSKEALSDAVNEGNISPKLAAYMSTNLRYEPDRPRVVDQKQYEWLKRVLQTKSAKEAHWKIVMGHFPIRSASKHEHGDTPTLVKRLDSILRENQVDIYFSGHDHILQHIHRGGSVHYFGSGAGAKKHKHIYSNYRGLKGYTIRTFGFMKHEATETTLKTTFVITDGTGSKNYSYTYTQKKFRLIDQGDAVEDELITLA